MQTLTPGDRFWIHKCDRWKTDQRARLLNRLKFGSTYIPIVILECSVISAMFYLYSIIKSTLFSPESVICDTFLYLKITQPGVSHFEPE